METTPRIILGPQSYPRGKLRLNFFQCPAWQLGNFVEEGKKRRIKFQINKNAENPTLKAMAAKDSHIVYAETDVDIGQEPTEENAKKIFDEVKKQISS